MTKIINAYDGARIYELDKFHSMLSDDYLVDPDNIQTKFIFQQFLNLDKKNMDERLSLLNLSYSLPSLITEKFADYVGEPENSLDICLDAFVSAFIWGGTAIFRPKVLNGEFVVDYVSPSEYILNDDGSERILFYYQVATENGTLFSYILEEYYNKNKVVRTLYRLENIQKFREYTIVGTIVPLTELPQTADLQQFETFPNIDFSPIVTVHNRILKGRKYGTSEMRKIRSLISSIEIEAVNIQDQFLKHLQAKLAVPNSALKTDKNGIANVRDLEAFGMESGDTLPAYITNSNPLIDKAFDQIEDFLRQICAIITLPTEFMGLKDGGTAESADTKKIRLASFIKKVEKIRDKFEDGLSKLDEIRTAWVGAEDSGPLTITWPAIFPDDSSDLANELSAAQDARLISNLKAIMRFQGLSEDEALKEQDTINKEKATFDPASMVVPGSQPPENQPNLPAKVPVYPN